ncbi:GNAT family N-acetyltransferase [Candidatus Bipolaricaulota bacterium]|nr:GNAT family N-acetyltransferase [Candidatus Bipolaricaulota bacterium]
MRIALVQQHATSDKAENLARGLKAVREAARQGAKLVCFAELAFEPFYPQRPSDGGHRELAEPIPGPITDALCALAEKLGVVIVPNLYECAGEDSFDTSPIIDADGRMLGLSRMNHIPDYEAFHEKTYYTPGDLDAPVFSTAVGRIGVAICYDRHYPEMMRALALGGADLVLVPQAGAIDEWPEGLFEAEMRVAAFQNGYFVALCNRVGKEEILEFAGESFVCDPGGNVIARAAKSKDDILICDIDLDQVASSHARKLFLPDRRPELYAGWLSIDETPERAAEPEPDAIVSLRVLTEETLRPILKLSKQMPPGQEKMVAPNAVSIAQAHFNEKAWFRGIYADDTPVGFVMLYDDPDTPQYFLWRLMIAGPQQGKGYGRKAMERLIEYVRGRPGATELKASYMPMPGGPWPFYQSLGFEPTGEMEGDEVVIRLRL